MADFPNLTDNRMIRTPLPANRFPGALPTSVTPSIGAGSTPPLWREKVPRVFSQLLTVAQTSANPLLLNTRGSFVWFVNSTNATDQIFFRFSDTTGDRLPLLPGQSINGIPFTRMFLDWTAVAAATAFIMITDTYPDENFRNT